MTGFLDPTEAFLLELEVPLLTGQATTLIPATAGLIGEIGVTRSAPPGPDELP
jgi:hypothetical protein